MAKRGLDIELHRRRLVKEDLDEKFKAAEDPLRLVFVCAMWITGFDVPTCSTVYIDKLKREKFILDWRLRETAKADVRETIRQEFDQLPDVYERKLWDEKVERTYQFVFEHFATVPASGC
jgi:hypothetical protein